MSNYSFFDIFLDILHELEENFSKEHVERGFYLFRAKIETISLDISGKVTFFLVLTVLFHLSLPIIRLSHLKKL